MNECMEVRAVHATNFSLGNPAHLAPEVLSALAAKGRLARHSVESVTIPLAKQPSFEAGVLLFEIAMGLDHPVNDYPAVGNSQDAFAAIDSDGLREVAGAQYAEVVLRLLAYDPGLRSSLADARGRLLAAASDGAVEAPGGAEAPEPQVRVSQLATYRCMS